MNDQQIAKSIKQIKDKYDNRDNFKFCFLDYHDPQISISVANNILQRHNVVAALTYDPSSQRCAIIKNRFGPWKEFKTLKQLEEYLEIISDEHLRQLYNKLEKLT